MDGSGMAIERNGEALRRILALVFVYLGLADDTAKGMHLLSTGRASAIAFDAMAQRASLPRRVHHMARVLLLPVESATRRLIVTLAARLPTSSLPKSEITRLVRSLSALKPLRLPRTWVPGIMVPQHLFAPPKSATALPARMPRFSLLDPLKRFNRKRCPKRRSIPRIGAPDTPHFPIPAWRPQSPDDPVPDINILRRVAAVADALADLPRQAQRFARWRARRNVWASAATVSPRPRLYALRPGRPPGSPPLRISRDSWSEEHAILADTHHHAFHAGERHDSS